MPNSEEEKIVTCPKCQNELGRLVSAVDTEWLQMGGGICREWHGVCAQCGAETHWVVADQILKRLIKNVVRGGLRD